MNENFYSIFTDKNDTILTFRIQWIVTFSYYKSQQYAIFLNIIFAKEFHMFRTELLSIISGFYTVFTGNDIGNTSSVDCPSSPCQTVSLSETCRILYQNKDEKYCILLAFIIRKKTPLLHRSFANIETLSQQLRRFSRSLF